MVVYVARCSDEQEAKSVRNSIIAACPTLVYARVLHRPQDLDVFNGEILETGLSGEKPGGMLYEQRQAQLDTMWRVLLVVSLATVLIVAAGIWLSVRLLTASVENTALVIGIWALLVAGLAIVSMAVRGSVAKVPVGIRILWQAERWLRRKRPVVIAASDELPDDQRRLPKNVVFFDHMPGMRRKQAA